MSIPPSQNHDDDDDVCSICLDPVPAGDAPDELDCGHRFHARCVRRWNRPSCPYCRAPVSRALRAERRRRRSATARRCCGLCGARVGDGTAATVLAVDCGHAFHAACFRNAGASAGASPIAGCPACPAAPDPGSCLRCRGSVRRVSPSPPPVRWRPEVSPPSVGRLACARCRPPWTRRRPCVLCGRDAGADAFVVIDDGDDEAAAAPYHLPCHDRLLLGTATAPGETTQRRPSREATDRFVAGYGYVRPRYLFFGAGDAFYPLDRGRFYEEAAGGFVRGVRFPHRVRIAGELGDVVRDVVRDASERTTAGRGEA